jgi:ComF family protein
VRWRRAALAAFVEPWRAAAGGRCAICRGWCAGALCPWCEARCARKRPRCRACGQPLLAFAEGAAAPGARLLFAPGSTLGSTPGSALRSEPGSTAASAPGSAPGSTLDPIAAGSLRCARCPPQPPGWSQVVVGVDYDHPWDHLLTEFKFHGRIEHAQALLQPLHARLRADPLAAPPAGLRVLPVPVARERLRERGYNQAWELARRLAHAHGLAASADILFRVRETGHQLGLPRAARQENLRAAFVVTPRRAARVRGARLALVDDVMTTGATATAATRALLAAGAAEVRVWVVARA